MSRPRRDGSPAQRVTAETRARVKALRPTLTLQCIADVLGVPLTTVWVICQPSRLRYRDLP